MVKCHCHPEALEVADQIGKEDAEEPPAAEVGGVAAMISVLVRYGDKELAFPKLVCEFTDIADFMEVHARVTFL